MRSRISTPVRCGACNAMMCLPPGGPQRLREGCDYSCFGHTHWRNGHAADVPRMLRQTIPWAMDS
eukprot:NODE_7577_length_432_cov_196.578249.p3 GENE.NODE_7577_length_432_cov_196.578249~~NODE_7577_length_432_cov_196.578249.p3  ORF type:complete len:65 (+),score=6.48 NODE_7577_length_432_cov_196.578249:151-345(+)